MPKPTIRTTTSALVTVTLEVRVGSWGPDCALSQVYQQASEEAANAVRRIINDGGQQHSMRVVRIDSIKSITTDAEQTR